MIESFDRTQAASVVSENKKMQGVALGTALVNEQVKNEHKGTDSVTQTDTKHAKKEEVGKSNGDEDIARMLAQLNVIDDKPACDSCGS